MTRRPPAVVLSALAVGLAAAPGGSPACAPAPPAGQRVDVTSETALIVWDEANKTQHFVRRATFTTGARDFGFLVPTPSRPEVAEANDELFADLVRITARETVVQWRWPWPTFAGGKALPEVVVLDQGRVGPFVFAVLALGSGKGDAEAGAAALAGWLRDNGYPLNPALEGWLRPYARDGWVVTAFKVGGAGSEAVPGKQLQAAVRMSFKTDRPFFPYREPEDQRDDRAKRTARALRVYLAADRRFDGKLGDGSAAWSGQVVWSDRVAAGDREQLRQKAGLPAGAGPAGEWWLTEFEDTSSPRPGTDELYFGPSADPSAVRRPALVVEKKLPEAVWLLPCCGLPILLPVLTMWVAGVVRRRWAGPGSAGGTGPGDPPPPGAPAL